MEACGAATTQAYQAAAALIHTSCHAQMPSAEVGIQGRYLDALLIVSLVESDGKRISSMSCIYRTTPGSFMQ